MEDEIPPGSLLKHRAFPQAFQVLTGSITIPGLGDVDPLNETYAFDSLQYLEDLQPSAVAEDPHRDRTIEPAGKVDVPRIAV